MIIIHFNLNQWYPCSDLAFNYNDVTTMESQESSSTQ